MTLPDPRFGPPPVVGPPPQRPREPEVVRPNHVLHLLLTVITFGFWFLIWGMVAMNASAATEQNRKRYEADVKRYAKEYDAWQQRYIMVYGVAPIVL